MRYTVPIAVEKALEILGVEPLYLHYGEPCDINGFSTATRERRRQDILWLNDNSAGSRPYVACGARHCIYITSRAEEAGALPTCEPDRSLIVLPHTIPLRRLVMAMEQCFAFYNAWSDALLDIVRRGGDWFELIEEGHRVIGNPMIIYNRSMRILAYTVNDGTRDAIWSDTVKAGVARVDSPQRSEDLMQFIARVEQSDKPFSFRGEGMSEPFWSAPVRIGDRPCGMVNTVEFHHPLSPGERDLLRFFAEYVAVGMQRSNAAMLMPDALPRQFVLDLIEGNIPSHDRLNTRLIAVEWNALRCFRFICMRSSLPFLSGEQWRNIYNQLLSLGLNTPMAMLDRAEPAIGLLLTAPAPERFSRRLETLRQFCAMHNLRAGISDIYGDLLETPRFFRQAEVALELVDGDFCPYEQARYRRMLRHLRNHPRREDLMHPAVARIIARADKEGAEYLQTLHALINHAFNQVEAAEALGIHRTTLAYRLRRIQELTGLRLDDPGQVFHVAVSLKLLQDDERERGG